MLRHPPGSPPPTPKLRVLIVDDEPLARTRVRTLLERDASLEIAGECASGPAALSAIDRDRPDILVLDMQMPGCDGLEVVAHLPDERRPAIIFVTAHEQFAVAAFAAQVVDYLLKPFDADRLQLAVRRAMQYLRDRRVDALSARVETLLASANERNPGRLAFKAEGRVIFLRPDEIVWVEAANNYAILHLQDGKRLMLRETLSTLEQRLATMNFARISRSALVHLEEVRELQPSNYGDYVVVLRNGRRLPLSRGLRGRFAQFIAKDL